MNGFDDLHSQKERPYTTIDRFKPASTELRMWDVDAPFSGIDLRRMRATLSGGVVSHVYTILLLAQPNPSQPSLRLLPTTAVAHPCRSTLADRTPGSTLVSTQKMDQPFTH